MVTLTCCRIATFLFNINMVTLNAVSLNDHVKSSLSFLLPDLHPGQAVMVSRLTEDDLSMNYQSDASDKFVPYISNPNVSTESTERLLSGR